MQKTSLSKLGNLQDRAHPNQNPRALLAGEGYYQVKKHSLLVLSKTEGVSNTIYFWRNGFTVNNGPLRGFDDPENAEFLKSIKKSECPEELKPSDGSSGDAVRPIHRQTNYSTLSSRSPNKRSMQKGAFRGTGRTLGTDPKEVPDTSADVSLQVPLQCQTPSLDFKWMNPSLPHHSR